MKKKVLEKDFKRLTIKLAADKAGGIELSDASACAAIQAVPDFWSQQGQQRKRGGEARARRLRADRRTDIKQLALAQLALELENPCKHFNLRRVADRAEIPYKRAQDLCQRTFRFDPPADNILDPPPVVVSCGSSWCCLL